ncbi:hypothetical protein [Azorhizobium caulinodans]|uniref:hypothetical protein n=1 Tax=Azorhizobium caulinodans TaxID=7 RepID=UPI0005C64F31|nr:hypothetical protein [Azorhizobium caulinodans]
MPSFNPTLSDVLARRGEVKRLIDALKTEDAELEMAERVLKRLGHPQGVFDARDYEPSQTSAVQPQEVTLTGKETTEEVLIHLLSGAQLWWTANQLQEAASRALGREVPMTTVSPTLSLMKGKKLISRDGLKVALASRVTGLTEDDLKDAGIIPPHATLRSPPEGGSQGGGVMG